TGAMKPVLLETESSNGISRRTPAAKRPADHRGPPGAQAEPELRSRQQRLEDRQRVCRLPIRELNYQRPAQWALWPFLNEGTDRHASGVLARILDVGDRGRMAEQRRDRHHGVLSWHTPGQCGLGNGESLEA